MTQTVSFESFVVYLGELSLCNSFENDKVSIQKSVIVLHDCQVLLVISQIKVLALAIRCPTEADSFSELFLRLSVLKSYQKIK